MDNKILVNVEGPVGIQNAHWIVSLTIANKHFIDNQYSSLKAALESRRELIENHDNFVMGNDYGGRAKGK